MSGDLILQDQADRDVIRGVDPRTLDDTVIVEAAAGTGKTTELVHRIVRVLATGRARIEQIAAVTFTEKAAGELKLRLREAVEKARRTASGDEAPRLDAALQQLENAHVTTIHGFCADLLRERPVEAGLDPLFDVLTDTQAARLFGGAFDVWLQEQLAEPGEGVRRFLRRRTWPNEDEASIEGLKKAGLDLAEWRDFECPWHRPEFDRVGRIEEVFDALKQAAALLRSPSFSRDALFHSTRALRHLVDDTERMETAGGRDHDGLEAQFVSLARSRDLSNVKKGSGASYRSGVSREDVWRAVERAKALVAAFELDAGADLASCLRDDLQSLIARYERAKADAGVVDFLDLLVKARDLIRNDRGVRERFQRRFSRIFVDEFQDTDPLQAEILILLAAADPATSTWRDARTVQGKLFLVGDPKQAIYRFRRADVDIYQSVYDQLERAGARKVTLRSSFRARPNIQHAINAAFAPAMTRNPLTQQAAYVPLETTRSNLAGQPSMVVLPVPHPYATRRIAASAIDKSLPDAVGAFVDWLVNESKWKVEVRGEMVPLTAGHICLLFRRFVSFETDVTRAYVEALEARGVPHLLIGGRSFHNRAEVDALRAALAAIERPDDELSVFAALRGPFFGIDDDTLLRYRARYGRCHPFRIAPEFDAGAPADEAIAPLRPVADALALLRSLHGPRNRVPVATTIAALFEATRAHVRFAFESGGEQVLANVLRVADLARQFEADGGASFRGFLEELDVQAETGRAEEAPILEDASDGVRLMTVHKAKGLEFPVVILADVTAKLRPAHATRYIDGDRRLCAIRLGGCSPDDLTRQGLIELERDAAEGVRLAYVAATRARDLLVVPAVGDEEREGWLETLNPAIYPPLAQRRAPARSPFRSKDSVMSRPDGDSARPETVSPGLHRLGTHDVVWWDPHELHLGATAHGGLRHGDLIRKDVPPEVVAEGRDAYRSWQSRGQRTREQGASPSIVLQQVTSRARLASPVELPPIDILRVEGPALRPHGRRFGTLVHAVLGSMPLDADRATLDKLSASQGRLINASDEEVAAAAACVASALAHPILARARAAQDSGRCRREVPIAYTTDDGVLLEGVLDLAFEDLAGWTIVDFKTYDTAESQLRHRRQVAHYMTAVAKASGRQVSGAVLYV